MHIVSSGKDTVISPEQDQVGIDAIKVFDDKQIAGWLVLYKDPDGGSPIAGKLVALEALRAETSWIDPEVYLWNDSLYANMAFGSSSQSLPLDRLLHGAELSDVLQSMPDGLQTRVGEAGGFLSAGQAQRIRIARAMARSSARLVILDEPVRSLEHERRRRMIESFRRHVVLADPALCHA